MSAKSGPGSTQKIFSSKLPVNQTRFWHISKQSLLRRTRERSRVALIHVGISPDYNHLLCLYSACKLKTQKQTVGTGHKTQNRYSYGELCMHTMIINATYTAQIQKINCWNITTARRFTSLSPAADGSLSS